MEKRRPHREKQYIVHYTYICVCKWVNIRMKKKCHGLILSKYFIDIYYLGGGVGGFTLELKFVFFYPIFFIWLLVSFCSFISVLIGWMWPREKKKYINVGLSETKRIYVSPYFTIRSVSNRKKYYICDFMLAFFFLNDIFWIKQNSFWFSIINSLHWMKWL